MWHWVHCTGGEVEMARWPERWQPFQLVLGQQDVANSTPAAPPPTFCKNNLARLCKGFVCVLGDNESSKLVLSDRQTIRQKQTYKQNFCSPTGVTNHWSSSRHLLFPYPSPPLGPPTEPPTLSHNVIDNDQHLLINLHFSSSKYSNA